MKKHKKIIASIIVANFNNAKFLDECLRSIFSQTFKSYEIIVVDDNSKDNSIEILNKYKKKIFIIQNKKKTKYGSFNQINSYYKGFLRSKGTFIFFLDSDDYFKKDKLKSVIKTFQREKKQKLIFDLPILKYKNDCVKNTFKQKFFFISNWPRFSPQSCISVRKDYADELFTNLRIKKFITRRIAL